MLEFIPMYNFTWTSFLWANGVNGSVCVVLMLKVKTKVFLNLDVLNVRTEVLYLLGIELTMS